MCIVIYVYSCGPIAYTNLDGLYAFVVSSAIIFNLLWELCFTFNSPGVSSSPVLFSWLPSYCFAFAKQEFFFELNNFGHNELLVLRARQPMVLSWRLLGIVRKELLHLNLSAVCISLLGERRHITPN